MAKTKAEKGVIIDKLEDAFKTGASSVFVHFTKVTVTEESAMRRALRADGVSYFVAKKTLIRKSLEGGKEEGKLPSLQGEVAVAYLENGNDTTAPAREVFGLEKKLEKAVHLIGGIFEGKFIGEKETLALASIPSRQTLLAQFTNLVNSPIQRFVVALDQIAKVKK